MDTMARESMPHASAPATGSFPVLVSVRHLIKRYEGRAVLNDVSFDLAQGERLVLMGPSGSGKSTLLNCLGGIDRPDSGSIQFAGRCLEELDGNGLAALRRKEIATVFQFFHLLPMLSAAENIELPLQLNGISRQTRTERVRALMEETGISHRAEAKPAEMSGGERQRVALARALITEPRLLLADEPTGNLDRTSAEAVLDLIERTCEARQTSLVMVTHNAASTRIAHRVCEMRDGLLITAEEPSI